MKHREPQTSSCETHSLFTKNPLHRHTFLKPRTYRSEETYGLQLKYMYLHASTLHCKTCIRAQWNKGCVSRHFTAVLVNIGPAVKQGRLTEDVINEPAPTWRHLNYPCHESRTNVTVCIASPSPPCAPYLHFCVTAGCH